MATLEDTVDLIAEYDIIKYGTSLRPFLHESWCSEEEHQELSCASILWLLLFPGAQTPCQLLHMDSPTHQKLPLDTGGESIPDIKDIKERNYVWRHLPFDIIMPACFPNLCKVSSYSVYFNLVSWDNAFIIISTLLKQLVSQVHGA